jgi:myo-inositol-1(or 4)-monophosphatase
MDLEHLAQGAERAAREAGDLLLDRLGRVSVEHKGEVDLVTEADRESERFLVERLTTLLPGAAILAEEGSGASGTGPARWIVDPLDGTTNYAHGYPVFCVSIALEVDGATVLGVVHDPTRDECFTARRGAGAWLAGRRLGVSRTADLPRALLVTGFPYDVRTSPRDNLTQFAAFAKRARGVRRGGSAALDLSYVAAGRLDGFWEEKLHPWDVAAGVLLVTEAGGRVSGYLGNAFDMAARHIVATNGLIHDAMVRVLAGIEEHGTLPPVG